MVTSLMDVHIRWMLARDMDRVMEIEQASFADPWTRGELIEILRGRNTLGIVAEDQRGDVAGFAVYELLPVGILLLNLAVDPVARHRGIGRQIIWRLINKLTGKRRTLRACVSERNLSAQLFFKQCAFRATAIEHGAYGVPDHDAYRMDHTVVTFSGRLTRTTMKGL